MLMRVDEKQGNQQSNIGGGPGGDGRDDKDKKVG